MHKHVVWAFRTQKNQCVMIIATILSILSRVYSRLLCLLFESISAIHSVSFFFIPSYRIEMKRTVVVFMFFPNTSENKRNSLDFSPSLLPSVQTNYEKYTPFFVGFEQNFNKIANWFSFYAVS